MLIAQGCAIVAYLPAGMVASKIGRKKTILAGIVMLATAFTVASFMRAGSPAWLMYLMFALAGIAWATINVNSFPMVVEMCSGSNVGKYTGFYYTASMAAQTATPMISGYLMDKAGMTALFPYAAVFVALAFVTAAAAQAEQLQCCQLHMENDSDHCAPHPLAAGLASPWRVSTMVTKASATNTAA